jgi:prepilin-type N-terminal cleavage/methylation domain-containing protein
MEKIINKEGFTLLEVIFAVSILTVGILSVAVMQASSLRGNAFAWGTSEASNVAMAQIEAMLEWSYDDARLTDDETHDGGTTGKYNISWTVADDAVINQTKTVNVTVSWRDHGILKNLTIPFVLGQVI